VRIYFQVNLSLAAFNLLPIYPLDGAKVLSAILPSRWSRAFDLFFLRFGMWPLVGVVLWEWILPFPGPISLIMGPFSQILVKIVSYSFLGSGV
jgi:Zn-dependent protease